MIPNTESNAPPPLAQQAWNLATAIAAFVADGCQTVSREQYEQRLQTCESCLSRSGQVCLVCGCYVQFKAHAQISDCPLAKWPHQLSPP